MQEEINNIKGLEIYSPDGIFIGYADHIVVDIEDRRVVGIFVSETSPVMVDEGKPIQIPYRWVQAIGDIIILKVFPKHINADGTLKED